MADNHIFSCSWDKFEEWIRQRINRDFFWKLRTLDIAKTREIIVESIEFSIKNNNGIFPESGDMFIEKLN